MRGKLRWCMMIAVIPESILVRTHNLINLKMQPPNSLWVRQWCSFFFYICCCCITVVQFRRKSWKNGRVTMWRHRRATASGCIVTSRAFRLPMSCGIADLFPVATFMTVDSELSTLVKIIFEVVLRESVKALDFRWRSAFLLLFRVYKTTCVFVFVFMCNVVTLLII